MPVKKTKKRTSKAKKMNQDCLHCNTNTVTLVVAFSAIIIFSLSFFTLLKGQKQLRRQMHGADLYLQERIPNMHVEVKDDVSDKNMVEEEDSAKNMVDEKDSAKNMVDEKDSIVKTEVSIEE